MYNQKKNREEPNFMEYDQILQELLDNASSKETREKLLNRYNAIRAIEAGDPKTTVSRQFGIDRTSLYKLWNRYQEHGITGIADQYPSGESHHNTLDSQTAGLITGLATHFPALYPQDISFILKECYGISVSHTTVRKYCQLKGLATYMDKRGYEGDEVYIEEIPKNSSEIFRLSVLRVNGKYLVHIRIWKYSYTGPHDILMQYNMEYLPTHSGLLLTVDQLHEIMNALEETLPHL